MNKNLLLLLATASLCVTGRAQTVSVSRQPLTLPTYEIGAPDPNPIFFTGRVYQGAQGPIYPYPLYDVLTDKKVDKTYNALYLENQYVKVCMLPEIGGRILSATDKTDNYEIFYRQTGIKPALIGMLGAWLSGGVEWNLPHHHRASSYMPVDWKTEENADGSKTIWVGETELTERLKWSIGITVYPNRSWVEARVRIVNRTPFIQSMLYWANVSVHCGEKYEVIFPPSTQFGTDHSKVYFTHWPMGDVMRGSGRSDNLAWWKNYTDNSRSVFAWNFDDDFLAGYDHGKQAGTVHVANHHIVLGKKFFLWGNNDRGRMWDKMLSDNDGSYLELMVGAYSNNQPDYSWIGPGETREFTQRWYGIRDIESVKNANDDAAVNLEVRNGNKAFVGFNATTVYSGAKAQLLLGDKKLLDKTIDISPDKPFTTTVSLPKDAQEKDLRAVLLDKDGKELVSYKPVQLEEKPLPKVIDGTKPVKDYATVEELYFAGLRVEQFHNARLDPMDFYNEALSRDSLDSRVNTAVGIRMARQGRWAEAEKYLKRALVRPTHDYTVVHDAEPHYYLGIVYRNEGKTKEAKDELWKTTWTTSYQHAAFFALAQMACQEGDFRHALEMINRSINVGGDDTKALVLKAYILRKLGKEAGNGNPSEFIKKALEVDPLDYWALAEQSVLNGKGMSFFPEAQKQRGKDYVALQDLLEMSVDYAQAGAYTEASQLLDEAASVGKPYSESPMLHYYNGYFKQQLGKADEAQKEWAKAATLPVDEAFPFRLEAEKVLLAADSARQNDAYPSYYLGNLYYYLDQKDRGMTYWQKSEQKGGQIATLYRNLGFGYGRLGELDKAIAAYKKAIGIDNSDPRYFKELDILEEGRKVPAAERLAILEQNKQTVLKHDEAVMRLLTLYDETGQYDKAIEILNSRHFHVWEGGGEVHDIYVDAHQLKGYSLLQQKKYKEAVAEFEAADAYPDNLEVGRPSGGGHSSKGYYLKAQALKAAGDKKGARQALDIAARYDKNRKDVPSTEQTYFTALALKDLGRTSEADNLLSKLQEGVDKQLSGNVTVDAYSKFGEDGSKATKLAFANYLKGLLERNNGNESSAESHFKKALELNPDLIWAQIFSKQK